MTCTYRFQIGIYSFTDIPSELHKAMDSTLIGSKSTYGFLDDILIVSKRTGETMILNRRLCEEILGINLSKCHSAKLEVDWLGFQILQTGVSPT